MASAALVRLERDGALARIVLARPDAGNAVSRQLCRELRVAAETCAASPDIRAVILRAEGRAFCVGGDLAEFEQAGAERPALIDALASDMHAAEALLIGMRAPLIVAVQGAAAGAGMSLAMMGDIVVAGASAHFTVAYTAIGLSSDSGSTHILPRLIGLRRTQELMLTNRRLSADEALDWGMVTSVAADDELADHVEGIARRLATGPTAAYGVVKRLLAQTYGTDFAGQVDTEGREIARLAGGADAAEGIAAFMAKRPAVFTGASPE